jgi:hypothetical protein
MRDVQNESCGCADLDDVITRDESQRLLTFNPNGATPTSPTVTQFVQRVLRLHEIDSAPQPALPEWPSRMRARSTICAPGNLLPAKESEQISEMNQQMLRRKASRRGQKHANDSRLS